MSEILERIKEHFTENIQTKIITADSILPNISYAAEKLVQCLLEGQKILTCGSGASTYDALHFASKMLNRFQQERPSLPAIALTSDPITSTALHETNSNDIYAKQLRALGQTGDILFIIAQNNNSNNLLQAIEAAQEKKIQIIALTGGDGGKIATQLSEDDIEIRIPSYEAPRIHETHLLVIHCLCDSIDFQLFGDGEISL